MATYLPDDLEAQKIDRQRRAAQMLREQPKPKGGMVGSIYVGSSPLQHLAGALRGYKADQQEKQADEQAAALGQRVQTRNRGDMSAVIAALRGKPAQAGVEEMDPMGSVPEQPAAPPDRNAAMMRAMQSSDPMLQKLGAGMMTEEFAPQKPVVVGGSLLDPKTGRVIGTDTTKGGPKWEKAEIPNSDGSKRVGYVNVNSPNPVATFIEGGAAPVKMEYVNGQPVNPYTATAQGPAIPKQPAPPNLGSDLVIPGADGKMVPNAPLLEAKKQIAKEGRSSTTVNTNVNTATKPFFEEIGKGVGKGVVKDFEAAQSAQGTLENAKQIEAGLSKVIVGPGAGVRVKLSQIGQILGINGADETERLQNTRNVMQGLARQELAAAAQMKGQGQITESERAILRKAEAGDISEMTVPELRTFLSAIRKTANYRIQVHNENLSRLKKDPNAAGVVNYMNLPGAATVMDEADKILGGGR